MSTLQRLRSVLPPLSSRELRPILAACAVAAAIVVLLAVAVLPVDADPKATSTPVHDVAANDGAPLLAVVEQSPTPRPRREVNLGPSPTPRQVQRAQPSPAATATPRIAATPAAMASPESPQLAEAQLLANRGFESADAWYLEQGAAFASGDAHRGEGYLLLASTGGYADQRFAVEPGVTYRVAMYVKVSTAGFAGGRIGVRYETGAGGALSAQEPVAVNAGDAGWRKVVFTFTTPPNAAQALLTFWTPFGSAALAIDDVSIRPYLPE